MNTNAELAQLVARASELRAELKSRLPFTVVLKFNDFVIGTASFTWQERGVYLGLLYRQFDKGHVPKPERDDFGQLAAIVNMQPDAFGELWRAKLAEKFAEHDGKLYNRVMLLEWIAQADYMASRRQAARQGGKRSAEVRRAAKADDDAEQMF
jgi:uncharacterized protein YdaU (DUF1376 family)